MHMESSTLSHRTSTYSYLLHSHTRWCEAHTYENMPEIILFIHNLNIIIESSCARCRLPTQSGYSTFMPCFEICCNSQQSCSCRSSSRCVSIPTLLLLLVVVSCQRERYQTIHTQRLTKTTTTYSTIKSVCRFSALHWLLFASVRVCAVWERRNFARFGSLWKVSLKQYFSQCVVLVRTVGYDWLYAQSPMFHWA